ncbi:MAG TPA: hypothetical protein VFL15_09400 [Gammaproteobacteria bacterium]|nr:hypothetical protein [Gammaproteobacteria bacterium]
MADASVSSMSMENDSELARNRRRARRTALVFAIVALLFYAAIFCFVHWRHVL